MTVKIAYIGALKLRSFYFIMLYWRKYVSEEILVGKPAILVFLRAVSATVQGPQVAPGPLIGHHLFPEDADKRQLKPRKAVCTRALVCLVFAFILISALAGVVVPLVALLKGRDEEDMMADNSTSSPLWQKVSFFEVLEITRRHHHHHHHQYGDSSCGPFGSFWNRQPLR